MSTRVFIIKNSSEKEVIIDELHRVMSPKEFFSYEFVETPKVKTSLFKKDRSLVALIKVLIAKDKVSTSKFLKRFGNLSDISFANFMDLFIDSMLKLGFTGIYFQDISKYGSCDAPDLETGPHRDNVERVIANAIKNL